MKSILIIIASLIIHFTHAQTDSVLVMIEDQLVLILEDDFESDVFIEINETYHAKKGSTSSLKTELLQHVLDEKKNTLFFTG